MASKFLKDLATGKIKVTSDNYWGTEPKTFSDAKKNEGSSGGNNGNTSNTSKEKSTVSKGKSSDFLRSLATGKIKITSDNYWGTEPRTLPNPPSVSVPYAGAKDPTVGNQQSEYERLSTYDVNAGKSQLEALKSQLKASKKEQGQASVYGFGENAWDNYNKYQTYADQTKELKNKIAALEREIQQAENFQKAKSYDVYREEQDFANFSKAGSSKKKSKGFSLFEQGDDRYDYINNIDDYRNTAKAVVSDDNSDNGYYEYDFMSNDEIGIYNYLYAKQGKEAANKYLEILAPHLNQRNFAKKQEYLNDLSEDHPVLMSVGSVPASVYGGVASAVDLGVQNIGKTVTGKPVDYYSDAQFAGEAASTIRGNVSEQIKDNTDWEIAGRNVPALLYNTVMSGADSAYAGLIGGAAGGGVILGSSAGASTARDIAARGGSDREALMGGIAAGIFEGLFERYSIGNFKALKEVPVNGFKDVAMNVLKSAGVNASEEAATEIANIVYDTVALGDISNWKLSIENYMNQGMSESEAKSQTVKDMFGQVAEAGISGGLMGIGFGGIGSLQSAVVNRKISDTDSAIHAENTETGQEPAQQNPEAALYQAAMEKVTEGNVSASIPVSDTVQENTFVQKSPQDLSVSEPVKSSNSISATSNSLDLISRAASVLGNEGKQAIVKSYDGKTDPAEYYASFARYYNVGLNGQKASEIQANGLTLEQQIAAYESGAKDRYTSLQKERGNVKYATAYGKESGFVWDQNKDNISKESAQTMNAVGKALGVKIMMADQVKDGTANASYENGVVTIARDAQNPVMTVLSHELTHRMQELAYTLDTSMLCPCR